MICIKCGQSLQGYQQLEYYKEGKVVGHIHTKCPRVL